MDRAETEYQKLVVEYEIAVKAYSRAVHALAAAKGLSNFKKMTAKVTLAHVKCDHLRTLLNAALNAATKK
jgi:capsule polysaccharide export protein KpsE/RkpR